MTPKQHGWTFAEKCTRITADGHPCPMPHLIWRWEAPDPLACWNHLTKDERKRWKDGKAADDARHRAHRAALARREPACWSWPVPDASGGTDAWNRLVAFQDGRCAVCGRVSDPLQTDHDHATGLIRGQLCVNCNVQEGFAKDVLDGRGFAEYYERPPAVILGIQLAYRHPSTRRTSS